jgi:hypothetical protein
VGDIEAGLDRYRPGQWQRLGADQLSKDHKRLEVGWRVNIPAGSLELRTCDHLVLAIDAAFPNSQPRIFAPAAGSDYSWPHTEQAGLLCLSSSKSAAPIADRVVMHLRDAEELLNFPESKRRQEFEREFTAYWSHRATNSSHRARVWSLVTPGGLPREVVYFFDARANRYVMADDKRVLKRWLRNTGANPGDKKIYSTWLFRLPRPWIPPEFPETGDEITKLIPPDMVRKFLEPGLMSPFLFEVATKTGTVFAAVVLRGAECREVMRGFRHISKLPTPLLINSYAMRPVERCKVARVDGAWVHGRDHSSSYALVKNRKVAVIGCGAIGAAVACLLAQAGVGEQIFVDADSLTTANVSRHLLGMSHVGFNKASALQDHLRREFPHLTFEHTFQQRFEWLTTDDLDQLSTADLIITAGIDFDGEAALDGWRRSLTRPPAHLSTWAEAYAAAGHAVLLYGKSSLIAGFDIEERPSFRLTDWPDEAGALISEAGCGNTFQPHGVIDLHPIVGMAAGLALNTLMEKVPTSCRRVWMGDPAVVESNGGMRRAVFNERLTICEFDWP